MVRPRKYFTAEDLKEKKRKHRQKYSKYYSKYNKYYYLKKVLEDPDYNRKKNLKAKERKLVEKIPMNKVDENTLRK
jgi:hypothetical protein